MVEKLHYYKCWDCDLHFSDEAVNAIDCPDCGSGKTGVDCRIAVHGNYSHPIHSDALAVTPDQRAEHERLFPEIRLDGQNRPIFDNYTRHEAYLKKTGFVKETQKIKPKGKKYSESNR